MLQVLPILVALVLVECPGGNARDEWALRAEAQPLQGLRRGLLDTGCLLDITCQCLQNGIPIREAVTTIPYSCRCA